MSDLLYHHHSQKTIRLLTYNIQAGIGSHRYRHLFTHCLRYVLPHRHAMANLGTIAESIRPYDIVALQEADAGSYRTRFLHQTDYLAENARFDHVSNLTTREIGNIATLNQSLLSRLAWEHVAHHRLPGSRHGRGAIEAHFHIGGKRIALISTHLSLRKSSRLRQFHYLAHLLAHQQHAIIMGDLNCESGDDDFTAFLQHSGMQRPSNESPRTFPSWQPLRGLDHILVKGGLQLVGLTALAVNSSDHLPVAAEIRILD